VRRRGAWAFDRNGGPGPGAHCTTTVAEHDYAEAELVVAQRAAWTNRMARRDTRRAHPRHARGAFYICATPRILGSDRAPDGIERGSPVSAGPHLEDIHRFGRYNRAFDGDKHPIA
jgi:hypothetical protein